MTIYVKITFFLKNLLQLVMNHYSNQRSKHDNSFFFYKLQNKRFKIVNFHVFLVFSENISTCSKYSPKKFEKIFFIFCLQWLDLSSFLFYFSIIKYLC